MAASIYRFWEQQRPGFKITRNDQVGQSMTSLCDCALRNRGHTLDTCSNKRNILELFSFSFLCFNQ